MTQLSYLHPEAKIGKNVTLSPFSTVYENVEIGDGTWVGPNVTIFSGARIGKNCKLFPGSVIAAIPQDLKFKGEETTAEIGDNTTIRECVTVNRGTLYKQKTIIGSNSLLMAYVHVAHDCAIGNNVIIANSVNLAGHVDIDDWVIIEGGVGISQFVKIGAHAFITGHTGVRKNVPPFAKAAREPLQYIGINSVGLRRRGFSNEKISEIQEIYRYIFVRNLNVSKALDMIERDLPATPERDEILSFINRSSRGVMKGYSRSRGIGE